MQASGCVLLNDEAALGSFDGFSLGSAVFSKLRFR